jgi:hypothetical protein
MFGQSLLSAFGSAACTTDTDQLFTTDVQTTSTATYQFNNATTSIPSNTYPGTPSNITYAAGKFGNAAVFNGSSSKISLGTIGFGATSQITISMWLKPNSSQVASTQIIDRSHNTVGGWVIQQSGTSTNQYYFALHTSTPFKVSSTISLTANVWSHLVFTINASGNLNAYLNNVQVITGDTGYGSLNNSLNLETIISGYAGSSGRHFNGSIDQLRIFNTALPRAAVTALYNETTTTATSASVDYQLANPNSIAYYKMSDATDQLGNYNGTATNVNFNTEGKFGFAGAFNGVNTRITTSLTTPNTQDLSWSFWVKDLVHNGSSTDNTLLLNYKNNYAFINYTSSNTIYANARNSSTNANVDVQSSAIDTSIWRHIVFVSSLSSGSFLYIDGALVDSNTASMPSRLSINYGSGLEIGWNPAEGSPFTSYRLEGKIDQVRIYDSALSAANVTTLYNEIECPAVAVTNAFNTVLYTGNGGTQAVTGTGFEPALVWIKERSNTAWHILTDSIRGENKAIYSNDTYQEESLTNVMNSFDSNGFTVGYNAAYSSVFSNKNGENYVAWNWKAPLANLSTGFNGSSSYISTSLSSSSINAMSFWLYFESGTTQYTPFGTDVGSGAGDIVTELGTNGSFSMTIQNKVYSAGAGALGSTGWKHIAYSSNQELYINGVLHTGGTTATTSNPSANLLMGGWNITIPSWGAFNSKIDQLRVYNTALTAGDVATLYAEPAASNNTLNYPAGAGCIAAYPLQTDAVDLSGNYNGASSNVTFGQPGYLTENTEGTIPSTVAANVDAGFSIVKWKGSGASGQSIGHGLNSEPELILQKRTNIAGDWECYHKDLGATKKILLNSTAAATTSSAFGNTAPTSTVSYAGAYTNELVNYYFHSVDGYSKIGSYVGTGTAGNFIYTGFQPRFLLTKRSSAAGGGWNIFDSTRGTDKRLYPNLSNAEGTDSPEIVTFNSNGFTFNTADSWNNGSYTYIYLAIA